jgi:hypothetical protein
MKAYWVNGGIADALLTSKLDGGDWSASLHGCFTPRERAPVTKLYRRRGGPQSWSGRGGEEKNFPAPAGTRTPDHPAST